MSNTNLQLIYPNLISLSSKLLNRNIKIFGRFFLNDKCKVLISLFFCATFCKDDRIYVLESVQVSMS